jgi:penicillin-binding protein 1C
MRRAAIAACAAAALCSGAALLRLWPHAPLRERVPLSSVVLDRRGDVLRITLATDGQVRLWAPLAQLPPPLVEGVLLHEDRYFYWHPGVNPVALVRAAAATLGGGTRQGASTITMQLARLLARHNTRSIGGKLRQIASALWLEARYSKQEILEAYLNLAPYGGNVQGVAAAAQLDFGRRPRDLDLPQMLALAVMPQAPEARAADAAPGAVESASLHVARLRHYAAWLERHPEDARQSGLVQAPLRFARSGLPFRAPHFANMALLRTAQAGAMPPDATLHTSLDLRLQTLLERRMHEYLAPLAPSGVRNASALLLDTRSMAVRAWVGSADYGDASIDGQVDGVLARRSPGSTLKPLLYALAMDQGLIHPLSVLKDAPTFFGAYAPENADGRFLGPVTAHDALIRSRNVPAVQLSARLGDPTLYRFLKSAGVALPMSERYYGLALTLGGGEVSMVELAQLYAMLANHGLWQPLHWNEPDAAAPPAPGLRLLSPEASYMVLDILRDNPRPDEAIWRNARRDLQPAWKTGTSWGFRDAWTAGVYGPYVLVVWIGNFNGESNPAFVGVQAAAPLFFSMVDALGAAEPGLRPPPQRIPPRLVRVEVCSASGDLPNADCPQRAKTWFIAGVSPIRLSTVHRKLRIDSRTGKQACADTPAALVREEVYEFWPSDLMRLFAQAGMPRRQPPLRGDCGSAAPLATTAALAHPPQIVSPLAGVDYALAAEALGSGVVPLKAQADAASQRLYWFADSAYLGSSAPGEVFSWHPARTGRVRLSVTDDLGASDTRETAIVLRD